MTTKRKRGGKGKKIIWPQWLRVLGPGVLVLFVSLTLWRILYQGIKEEASFDVPHLQAGAGDGGLVVMVLLGVLALALGVAWIVMERRWPLRWEAIVFMVAAVIVVPSLVFISMDGLQRYARGYSEENFLKLVRDFRAGRELRRSDVVIAVGDPLMKRSYQGTEQWYYTYMPSCGFGWDKRGVRLDTSGRVVAVDYYSEP